MKLYDVEYLGTALIARRMLSKQYRNKKDQLKELKRLKAFDNKFKDAMEIQPDTELHTEHS